MIHHLDSMHLQKRQKIRKEGKGLCRGPYLLSFFQYYIISYIISYMYSFPLSLSLSRSLSLGLFDFQRRFSGSLWTVG